MSGASDRALLACAIVALEPYLDDIVVAGGLSHFRISNASAVSLIPLSRPHPDDTTRALLGRTRGRPVLLPFGDPDRLGCLAVAAGQVRKPVVRYGLSMDRQHSEEAFRR